MSQETLRQAWREAVAREKRTASLLLVESSPPKETQGISNEHLAPMQEQQGPPPMRGATQRTHASTTAQGVAKCLDSANAESQHRLA